MGSIRRKGESEVRACEQVLQVTLCRTHIIGEKNCWWF